jgi:DNA polymerase-3 subunit gamma/tau
MSLYKKYRPSSFNEIKGNQQVISVLESMLGDLKTCPQVFLLHGPTGCGKTTIGRIIKDRLGCVGEDFKEVDSADFRGIDTVREIRRNAQYSPMFGSCRVWLIDEVHKMTNDAQNALLKFLEDTPKGVYIILATTDPQKLLNTIRGRCSEFQLKPLNEIEMKRLLKRTVIREKEKLRDEVYEQIIQDSQGLPRNALQILEQVLRVPEEKRLEIAEQTAAEQSQTIELCRALMKRAGWKEVSSILRGIKDQEPENIRRAVLGYASAVLLKKDDPLAGMILEEFFEPFYNTGFPGLVQACYAVTKN